MRRASIAAMLVLTLALAACGSGKEGGTIDASPFEPISTGESTLSACLVDAGFLLPENVVATVEVDETEIVETVEVPPNDSGNSNYVVVYEAPSEAVAVKAEKAYAGGPFIKHVGNLLYAYTGDPLEAQQLEAIESCLLA